MSISDFKNNKINELKESAEMCNEHFGDFDKAAQRLVSAHKNEENIKINFNGKELYSCEIATIDDAYMQYMGQTKDEYEKEAQIEMENYRKEFARKTTEAKEKIPSWIKEGEGIIIQGSESEWKRCVEIRAGDLYHGMDLENAIEIMKALSNGKPIEDATKIFDEANHSGASASIVRSIIFTFSPRGGEFYEKTNFGPLTPEQKLAIDQKAMQVKSIIGDYTKDEMKAELLNSMKLTRTGIELEDLATILPQDEMDNLKKQCEARNEHSNKVFFIVKINEAKKFELLEVFSSNPIKCELDLSSFSLSDLASLVEKSMIPHYQYGTFHGNEDISDKQVENTLESTIITAHNIIKHERDTQALDSIANDLLESDTVNIEKNIDSKEINKNNKDDILEKNINPKEINENDKDDMGEEI